MLVQTRNVESILLRRSHRFEAVESVATDDFGSSGSNEFASVHGRRRGGSHQSSGQEMLFFDRLSQFLELHGK